MIFWKVLRQKRGYAMWKMSQWIANDGKQEKNVLANTSPSDYFPYRKYQLLLSIESDEASAPSITKHRGTSAYTTVICMQPSSEALTMLFFKSRIEKKKKCSLSGEFIFKGRSLFASHWAPPSSGAVSRWTSDTNPDLPSFGFQPETVMALRRMWH